MPVRAIGSITITDLNDAIMAYTEPPNPTVGALWIKKGQNGEKDKLYQWNGTGWILQGLSLEGLDPEANGKIEDSKKTLEEIAADNLITVSERLVIKDKIVAMVGQNLTDATNMPTIAAIDTAKKGEVYSVRKEATTVGVAASDTTIVAYQNAYNALSAYLNGLSPRPWNVTLDANISVDKNVWRVKWLDYTNSLLALREAIAAKIKDQDDQMFTRITKAEGDLTVQATAIEGRVTKTVYENGISAVDSKAQQATAAANAAKSAADTAGQNATVANNLLADISSDSKLTPSEKRDTKKEWDIIVAEKPVLETQANTYGATAQKDAYVTAYLALNTYLTPLLNNLTTTDTINGVTFRSNFRNYYDKKTALMNKITDVAKAQAAKAEQDAANAQGTANSVGARLTTTEASMKILNDEIGFRVKSDTYTTGIAQTEQNAKDYTDTNLEPVITRLSNAELILQEDSIVSLVTESISFSNILEEKASAEAIGNLVTKDELDNLATTMDEAMNAKIGEIDFSPYVTTAQMEQTANAITQKFKSTGGMNIIMNSIGFAEFDFWEATAGITPVTDPSLDTLGFKSGYYFPPQASAATIRELKQTVSVIPGQPYTLSWYLNKVNKTTSNTTDGAIAIQILEGTKVMSEKWYYSADVTSAFESQSFLYTPKDSTATVRIYAYGLADATITGLMLSIGDVALQWTLATGELYNTNVRTDINGLRVSKLDENGEVVGYTSLTYKEFAGYHDANGDGIFEKIFYIQEDETVSKRFKAIDEITLGSIKIIKINSAGNNGWAFIPSGE